MPRLRKAPYASLATGEPSQIGPAFAALSPRNQKFVLNFVGNPTGTAVAALRATGYPGTDESCKVRASQLLRTPSVVAAVREVSEIMLKTLAPKAVKALHRLLDDPTNSQHVRAVLGTLDRVGMGAIQEHHVNHTHTVTDASKMAQLLELAERLKLSPGKAIAGLPPEQLRLAGRHAPVTDVEFTEVEISRKWQKPSVDEATDNADHTPA